MNRSFILLMLTLLVLMGCENKDKDDWSDYLNFFTLEDDIEFGHQLDSAIVADPVNFPILDKTENDQAYLYIETMMNQILGSELIAHEADFNWEVKIIDSDVLNAFAAPGGKLYFYAGIITYLDNAAQLAGVMAHEIAHSDRRHSSQQMSKAYGTSVILSLLLGEQTETTYGEIALNIASGLTSLQFSRDDEYEADEYSVKYLNDIKLKKNYDCKGIAGFFEKIETDGHTNDSFEFLKTHPTDEHRLENIESVWVSLSSPKGELFEDEYSVFKLMLTQ